MDATAEGCPLHEKEVSALCFPKQQNSNSEKVRAARISISSCRNYHQSICNPTTEAVDVKSSRKSVAVITTRSRAGTIDGPHPITTTPVIAPPTTSESPSSSLGQRHSIISTSNRKNVSQIPTSGDTSCSDKGRSEVRGKRRKALARALSATNLSAIASKLTSSSSTANPTTSASSSTIGAGTSRREQGNFSISRPRNYRNLKVAGLFGVELEVGLSGSGHGWKVASFVELLCLHIEQKLSKTLGLFRTAGNVDEVKLARDTINDGQIVDLWSLGDAAVGDLLKIYLRELPQPAVPCSLYHAFINLAQRSFDTAELKERLRILVGQMPKANQCLLRRVLTCLSRVAAHSEVNMMDVGNLATVFGPNLFRLPVSAEGVTLDSKACIEKQLEETALVNQVTGYLITHVAYAFQDVDYEPHYKYYVKVIKSFKPLKNEELELSVGDKVIVTDSRNGARYIKGEIGSQCGYFPADHVSLLDGSSLFTDPSSWPGLAEQRLRLQRDHKTLLQCVADGQLQRHQSPPPAPQQPAQTLTAEIRLSSARAKFATQHQLNLQPQQQPPPRHPPAK